MDYRMFLEQKTKKEGCPERRFLMQTTKKRSWVFAAQKKMLTKNSNIKHLYKKYKTVSIFMLYHNT
jgi:hypothetical protein